MISHGPDYDPWWTPVKNAIEHAEQDFNVQATYLNAKTGSIVEMKKLYKQVENGDYDGRSPRFQILRR